MFNVQSGSEFTFFKMCGLRNGQMFKLRDSKWFRISGFHMFNVQNLHFFKMCGRRKGHIFKARVSKWFRISIFQNSRPSKVSYFQSSGFNVVQTFTFSKITATYFQKMHCQPAYESNEIHQNGGGWRLSAPEKAFKDLQ